MVTGFDGDSFGRGGSLRGGGGGFFIMFSLKNNVECNCYKEIDKQSTS